MATRYSMIVTAGPDRKRQGMLAYQDRSKFVQALVRMLESVSSGESRAGQFDLQLDDGTNGSAGTPPSQTVTYSGSAGAQTVTIGGKQVAFTAGASDTLTAVAAVAAINADSIVGLGFIASNVLGVVTVKCKVHPRLYGAVNGITIAVTGTGATANGATLASGVSAQANGFTL